jgi:hypothetical protein
VTWSIQEGAAGGTITAAGVYTAPTTAGTYHVIATSQADTTKSATIPVTVTAVVVSVSAASATVYDTMTDQFTATVTGPTNTAVTWSIQEGAAGGTITAAGLYTAPIVTVSTTYHVVATSQADTTKTATFAVTVNPIVVSVTAASAAVYPGLTDQFTATVTGPTNTAVTWSIQEGAAGGAITAAGLYTAPAVTASTTYHVIATSQADTTKSATFAVTVTAVVVSVSAASATVYENMTDQFTATVTGPTNTAVTWSVQEGAAGGTITAAGLYTAPVVTVSTTYHVIATSQADTNESGTLAVTVNPIVVSVTAASATVFPGLTDQFSATVTGSTNTAVTWSVQEGAAGGTITAAGLYTAPVVTVSTTYHVIATSQADPTKSGTLAVTVNAVTVSVTAASATIFPGLTDQFTATVTGPTNTAVTWSIQENPAAGGMISAAGLYTAPAVTVSTTYHVIATSQADTTESATFAVTVNPSVVVHVTATSGSIYATQTDQFSATVTGSTNTAVNWSVQGGSGNGTINASGLYTAPAAAGTYTVIATSQVDDTQSASASVVVTIPTPTFTYTPTTTLGVSSPTYTYNAVATDPATTTISYALTSGPGSISGTTLSWTPTDAERMMPASFTVTATALGVTSTQTWTVTPYRTVTMTLTDNFHYTSLVSLPVSSLTTPVAAIVPGTPTATTINATHSTDFSTYTMTPVPAGYYWLEVGPTEKYWTNVNSFDEGTDYIGNLLSAPTTATPLTFDLTGGTFATGDALWVGSPSTNSWFAPQNPLVTPFLDAPTAESIAANTVPLIEAGDPSYVLQFSSASSPSGNAAYFGSSIAADVQLGTSFLYSDSITGLLGVTASKTLAVTTDGWSSMVPAGEPGTPAVDFFATYLSSQSYSPAPTASFGGGFPSCIMVGATATNVPCTTPTIPVPGLAGWPNSSDWPAPSVISQAAINDREAGENAGPLYIAFAELGAGETCSTCTPPDGGSVSLNFDYPFPTTWPIALKSQMETLVPFGGAVNSFALQSASEVEFSNLAGLPTAYTVKPAINPVTSPTINGASLYTTTLSYSAPLTLSWTAGAPVSGGATPIGYRIAVYAVPTSGAFGNALANIYTNTTNTSLILPTLGLPAGSYAFVIEARADASATLTASPFRTSYPRGIAQVVSKAITITGAW